MDDRLSSLTSATVHEALGQLGALPSTIRPVQRGSHLVGPAFTVQCAPRDNLRLHHALEAAPAGSILVCHVGGFAEAGYFGDVMAAAARARNLRGLVIAGCIRDAATLVDDDFAVFAQGSCVRGTTKDPLLPGSIGQRLRFDETDVDPGDLIVADDDGVVAVPQAAVDELVERAAAREAAEERIRGRLAAGETTMTIYGLPGGD